MNSRWGRQIDPKGSLKSSGQNNINININFNAVKDKANVFAGKKLDNFIQISNQPKSAISRPNVSMETLKQKKKKSINKQQNFIQQELQRKRSKSKIINQVLTPQKIWKDRQMDNSKSVGKKSTKKRSTKSFDNLKKFYGRSSPRQLNQKQYEISHSGETSKDNSREKSRSRSKSNKKLVKNNSKSKIPTGSASTKVKSLNQNTKKQQEEQKNISQKSKKQNIKNQRSGEAGFEKYFQANQVGSTHNFTKKLIGETRKKSSQNQNKKTTKTKAKTPKKLSIQNQSKGLKRLPLYFEEQEEVFEEEKNYKKLEKQAQALLHEQLPIRNMKKDKKCQNAQKNSSPFEKYIRRVGTQDELAFLNKCATTIQRTWRGYKTRTQFVNELNMMNHKIQITRNKIANLDPKFWDDAQSNSILKADDAQSLNSSEAVSQLNSQIEKSISENQTSNKHSLKKKRIVQSQKEREEMMERILKLEQNVKKIQALNQQLSSENTELKVNLQKVVLQSGVNSGVHSMEESLKSDQSWEVAFKLGAFKPEQDPFLEQQKQADTEQDKQFSIRMPSKIESSGSREIKNRQRQNVAEPSSNDNSIQRYKAKVSKYECSSPKHSTKMSINSNVLELFQKKEDQLKQSFQKKVNIFDRMLSDSIVSPRTYTLKKNELQQKFRHESEIIKNRKQQVTRVARYIKQIEDQQPKLIEKTKEKDGEISKPSVVCEQNHVIQDYGNLNLNSHRSKSESQDYDQFQSSLQSEKSFKDQPQAKYSPNESGAPNKIEEKNNQAIRIFQEVSQYQQKCEQIARQQNSDKASEKGKQCQIQNSSQVTTEHKKQPKGFETTLLFIKEYCVSFVEFIRGSEEHKSSFIQGICSPILYDSFEFLKAYRTTTTHENDSGYNSHFKQYIYPYFRLIYPKSQSISRQSFVEFNEAYEKLRCQCSCKADRQFFLNSLFDAFNESLDYKRPCSIYGQPPVWVSEHRGLKNHYLTKQDLSEKQNFLVSQKFDQICGLAIARVIEWSTSLCGFIPQSPEMENLVIQEEQINHIRETRIALMLEKDLLQNEQYMLDSIVQQTEVKLQISQILVDQLIIQLCGEIKLFFK